MKKITPLIIITVFLACGLYAEPEASGGSGFSDDPELSVWYRLIGSSEKDITDAADENGFGRQYFEITPGLIGSRADRVIYFGGTPVSGSGLLRQGLTVWFIDGRAVQLRFDDKLKGEAGGIGIGVSWDFILLKLGKPWIEDETSLYYNLPWRGAPVRLRFVFNEELVKEIYLYQVR